MLNFLSSLVDFGNNLLWSYVLIVLLIGAGLFFTIKNNFVQFKFVKEMIVLLGEGSGKSEKGISSFQAFCISTASRVGTGNLAGVALAVAAGGPGSVFWMWIIAILGSASAFVESTLAQVYKEDRGDGYVGGPSYYMEKALGNKNLGLSFSILITICFGLIFNSVQSNTISFAFEGAFGIDRTILGFILTVITGVTIFGGVKRIAKVAESIVPVMAVLYILVITFVLIKNFTLVPSVFDMIISSAFGVRAFAGGAIGAALKAGIQRGLFSNEAGMGSAPNAAATAEVSHPVKQGLIQTLGVFMDTLVICSATAFLILVSGAHTQEGLDGIQLTQTALVSQVGAWGGIFIALCILLFAFSSIIGNYYYGEANIKFMTNNKSVMTAYRVSVLVMVFFGARVAMGTVWDLADLFMGLMAIINIYAIIKLAPIAKILLDDYISQKKEGKNPEFDAVKVGLMEGTECWGGRKVTTEVKEKKVKLA